MNEPVPVELNLNNLRDVFERIAHLEAFIFFGTLLGYQREGNIIPHDDDVDIYVNAKHYEQLIEALSGSNFDVSGMPKNRWYRSQKKPLIVQASRLQNGIQTFADFYLYDDDAPDYLVEKWNFVAAWKEPMMALHVPKNLIFPLLDVEMQGIKIRIPAQPEALCAFLYGSGWKTPVRKGQEYVTKIVDHVPVVKPLSGEINGLKRFIDMIKKVTRSIYYRF